jgi:hypothetical protein
MEKIVVYQAAVSGSNSPESRRLEAGELESCPEKDAAKRDWFEINLVRSWGPRVSVWHDGFQLS